MITTDQLIIKLNSRFGNTVKCRLEHGQIILEIEPGDLVLCCHILRDEPGFKFEQLIDICGVDYLDYGVSEWATDTATKQGFSRGRSLCQPDPIDNSVDRFAVVYQLLSVSINQRLRLKTFLRGEPPKVPSVINIWDSANWYEREAFDLFGIVFEGHPDLRRILTDYGFIGHPFRKDFPLIGQVEMRYDATEGRVVYEPVSIEPRTLVPKIIRHVATKETTNG